MVDFTVALQQLIEPRLSALGFEYDPQLSQADELFAFRKMLSDDRQAVIQFQRSHNAAVYDFTINLISARSVEHQPGYEIEHGARLSYVLWFVYQRVIILYPITGGPGSQMAEDTVQNSVIGLYRYGKTGKIIITCPDNYGVNDHSYSNNRVFGFGLDIWSNVATRMAFNNFWTLFCNCCSFFRNRPFNYPDVDIP